MARYYRKFDAKAYWATKPLCSVCKNHKVKNGNICYKCKQEAMNRNRINNSTNIQDATNEVGNKEQANEELGVLNPNNDDFGVEVSAEAQNKIIRLFTYLEKALALDDTIVRDFRSSMIAPSPWWLSDYPRDLENLFIREFDTEKNVSNDDRPGAWLRVQKKNIESAPILSEKLIEWVVDVNPLDRLSALEKIARKVRFDNNKELVDEFRKFRNDFQQGDSV